MLSFPLLVIINHTNIKLAARRAKIESSFICRILYASLLHLFAKSEGFFGIWQVSILRVVFYNQLGRALNLNNYCQMSV